MLQRIRTIILSLAVLFGLGFTLAPTVGAVSVLNPVCKNVSGASSTDVCKEKDPGNDNPIIKILSVVITILSIIIGVASVIIIIVSGLRMITSGGDAQKVAAARSALMYALVGIVIAVLAGTIVAFVLSKL